MKLDSARGWMTSPTRAGSPTKMVRRSFSMFGEPQSKYLYGSVSSLAM